MTSEELEQFLQKADEVITAARSNVARADILEADRDRLVKALQFYADPQNYRKLGTMQNSVSRDGGEIARRALLISGYTS